LSLRVFGQEDNVNTRKGLGDFVEKYFEQDIESVMDPQVKAIVKFTKDIVTDQMDDMQHQISVDNGIPFEDVEFGFDDFVNIIRRSAMGHGNRMSEVHHRHCILHLL
jgi:hypothetical protein